MYNNIYQNNAIQSIFVFVIVKKDKLFLLHKGTMMLDMVIVFLLLAILAGGFGFSGVEIVSIEIARVLFFIFLILFVLSLIARVFGGKRPPIN